MAVEITCTPVLEQFIACAPNDLTEYNEATNNSVERINRWRDLGDELSLGKGQPNFGEIYIAVEGALSAQTPSLLSGETIVKFNKSLAGTAREIATSKMLFRYPSITSPEDNIPKKEEALKHQAVEFSAVEALAGLYLINFLTSPETEKMEQAIENAKRQIDRIEDDAIQQVAEHLAPLIPKEPATARALQLLTETEQTPRDLIEFINRTVDEKEISFSAPNNDKPAIRFMGEIYKLISDYCQEHKYANPLLDLTIGDVSAYSMPHYLREALGLNPRGPKGLAIHSHALPITQEMFDYEKSTDPHRYDLKALGWLGLRKQFINYATSYGLYDEDMPAKESILGDGGAYALLKAFLVARRTVELEKAAALETAKINLGQERTRKTIHEYYKQLNNINIPIAAYFANPGFRMVAEKAKQAGLKVYEEPTYMEDDFLPDPKKVDEFFSAHKDCKIFILTPLSNPSVSIYPAEKVQELTDVLKKHDAILINDFAYLGTGDVEENMAVGKELGKYKKRIDVLSMSKIFGRPGLRCGCAITPDEKLLESFVWAGQLDQLAMSYAMQAEAQAIWEKVQPYDRRLLAQHYIDQQERLQRALNKIDEERLQAQQIPLFDPDRKKLAKTGLYISMPLNTKQGIFPGKSKVTAFDLIKVLGLIGTPWAGFYKRGLSDQDYVRFALGVEEIA